MSNQEQEDEQIVQLICSCQQPLFLYLMGLLCSRDSAEDALQEANLVIWRKRAQYRPGTNFFAWACKVAFFAACKVREQRRRKVPVFSDVFLRNVAPELLAVAEAAGPLQATLLECVDELQQDDRELIERRYDEEATIRAIAASVGRSTDAVYKSLRRIHRALFDCITGKLNGDRP
jgi:RNA polymerase sigma-70 factor, ECF subfamily